MPLIDCRDCGAKVSDAAPACIHCGCPIGKPAAAEPISDGETANAPTSGQTQPSFACSYCKSQDVNVLPMVVAKGTSNIRTSTGTVGIGITGGGSLGIAGASSSTTGTNITELARMVHKPLPQAASVQGATVGCLGLGLITAILGATFGMMVFGAAAILSLLATVKISMSEARPSEEYNRDIYPKLLAKWQRSFLCSRCGRVTDPGEQS